MSMSLFEGMDSTVQVVLDHCALTLSLVTLAPCPVPFSRVWSRLAASAGNEPTLRLRTGGLRLPYRALFMRTRAS